MTDSAQINTLIDTLYIDMLDLIEQQVKCQLNIENSVVDGQLQIAKTRYTMGAKSITIAQLPTENTPEFQAIATVSQRSDEADAAGLELERHSVDKAAGFPDPLKWFGILLPQSMLGAQKSFTRAVEYSVECANVRLNLRNVIANILKLKALKNA